MMTSNRLVAWDACVLLSALRQEADRWQDIKPLVLRAEKGELGIVVSAITITEVLYLVKNASSGALDSQTKKIGAWFDNPYVSLINVDRAVAQRAAELRRKYPSLKTPDAIVLATALIENVVILYTYDGCDEGSGKVSGLLALNGKESGLTIAIPDGGKAGTLFEHSNQP